MGIARGRQREAQHLLGAGLADAAGDRDDLRLCDRALAASPIFSSALSTIVDDEQRTAARPSSSVGRDTMARPAPAFSAVCGKIMAVDAIALDGDENVALGDRCGCRSTRRSAALPGEPRNVPPVAATSSSIVHSTRSAMIVLAATAALTAS